MDVVCSKCDQPITSGYDLTESAEPICNQCVSDTMVADGAHLKNESFARLGGVAANEDMTQIGAPGALGMARGGLPMPGGWLGVKVILWASGILLGIAGLVAMCDSY